MFRKKKTPTRKPTLSYESRRRSLPVDRYYSPSNPRTQGDVTSRLSDRFSDRNSGKIASRANVKQLFSVLLRRAGFVALFLVITLNVFLGGTSVVVEPGVKDGVEYQYQEDEAYTRAVNSVYDSSIFNRLKLTVKPSTFEKQLALKLPELSNSAVVVPLVGLRLHVGLKLSDPLVRVQLTERQQGVIGKNGSLIYSDESIRMVDIYKDLPVMKLEPLASSTKPGSQLLTTDEVSLLLLLETELDGTEVYRPEIASIHYQVQRRELQVKLKGVSYFVKLTSERDIRSQVGALIASLKDLHIKGQLPTQYIDVRVEGRVFIQ